MQYIRRKIVVALGCVLIVVGAACGGTQQPTPAPTIDIEATVEARLQKKLAEDAALEADAVLLLTEWPEYREVDLAAIMKRMTRARSEAPESE